MTDATGHGGRKRRQLPTLLDPDELEVRTWVQMVHTCKRMERRMEQVLERHGLSLPQFDILATLMFRGEGVTQQELAERLLVTKGNICGMIDRMESSGWVERRPDPKDRRANRLFLTRAGKALFAAALPKQHATIKEIMSTLATSEIQSLYWFLDRLEEGIED
jgi:DNA-binding MarR family transcriptional regulator